MTQEEIKNLLNKAKLCNRLQEIPILDKVETDYNNYVNECTHIVIINMNEREKILYIPKGIKIVKIKNPFADKRLVTKIPQFTKKIKVVGGEDLEDISNLFIDFGYESMKRPHKTIVHGNMYGLDSNLYGLDSLDLSEMHISKVTNAKGCFYGVSAEKIILPNEIPEMLQDIETMFGRIRTDHILGIERITESRFATDIYCNDIFEYSRIIKLDLSRFSVCGFGYGDMQGARIDVLRLDKHRVSKESADLLLKQCKLRYDMTIERIELV